MPVYYHIVGDNSRISFAEELCNKELNSNSIDDENHNYFFGILYRLQFPNESNSIGLTGLWPEVEIEYKDAGPAPVTLRHGPWTTMNSSHLVSALK